MPTHTVNSLPPTTAQASTKKRKQPESPPSTSNKRICTDKKDTQNSLGVNSSVMFAVPTNQIQYPINHITQSRLRQHLTLIPETIWESYKETIITELRNLYSVTFNNPDWTQIDRHLNKDSQQHNTLTKNQKIAEFLQRSLIKDNYHHFKLILTKIIISSCDTDAIKEKVKANLTKLERSVADKESSLLKDKNFSHYVLLLHILSNFKAKHTNHEKIIFNLSSSTISQNMAIMKFIFKDLYKDAISFEKIYPSSNTLMTIEKFYKLLEKQEILKNITMLATRMQAHCKEKNIKTEAIGYLFFKNLHGIVNSSYTKCSSNEELNQQHIDQLNKDINLHIKFDTDINYVNSASNLDIMKATYNHTSSSATTTSYSK